MNLIIDTHAVIWFITGDEQLPPHAKNLIKDPLNTCFVSIASLWEMSIKYSLGKLELKSDLQKIYELIQKSRLTILPITVTHTLLNSTLDFHLRDPFDRIIISQAITEKLTVVSKDIAFKYYDIELLWK